MAGCSDQPFGPCGFRLLRLPRLQSAVLGRSALSLDETRSGAAVADQQRLDRQRIWGAPGPANLAGAGEVLLLTARFRRSTLMTKSNSRLHWLFELAIFVKGVDGVLETLGGLLILFVPLRSLDTVVRWLLAHEL